MAFVNPARQYEITQGRGNLYYVGTKANPLAHSVEGIDAALTLVSQMIERDTLPGMATGQRPSADAPADSKAVKPAEDGK